MMMKLNIHGNLDAVMHMTRVAISENDSETIVFGLADFEPSRVWLIAPRGDSYNNEPRRNANKQK